MILYATIYHGVIPASWGHALYPLQKKISNLHIVTDIKVTINSLPLFGFRHLGGGMGNLVERKKRLFL